jgi:hypothetical protein
MSASSPPPALLLHRHLPLLRYDSAERWFACSPALWAECPGHRLLRHRRSTEALPSPPGLAFLGAERYGDGVAASREDRIIAAGDDARLSLALELQADPRYRDRVLGRMARGSDGRDWLSYWFFYPYNDYTLLGPLIGAGRHEGDWEMVQLRLDPDGREPELALYAQHARIGVRRWSQLERVRGHPVIYVARGCHASWFAPGRPWTGAWCDHADGRGREPELQLEVIDEHDPAWSWLDWPGRWGGTRPGEGIGARLRLDASSPHGPGHQRQWRDPAVLLG